MTHAWRALEHRVRARPADPIVTFITEDDLRTELSARTLANNVAKAANALREELDPGARVALHLPWHWQRAVWTLAAWAVDLTVVPFGDGDLVIAGPVEAERLPPGAWVVSLHPLGLPGPVPEGAQDAATIARLQPDAFSPAPGEEVPALDGFDQRQLLDLAAAREVPSRFLVAGEPADRLDAWLLPTLVPLARDASIVMTAATEGIDAIARRESATELSACGP